jgi:hypothetical protein
MAPLSHNPHSHSHSRAHREVAPSANGRAPRSRVARLTLFGIGVFSVVACASTTAPDGLPAAIAPAARVTALRNLGITPRDAGLPLVLPELASGKVEIADANRHVTARFTLRGTSEAPRTLVGGISVYGGALEGADLVRLPIADGTEDFVFFDREPPSASLDYTLEMTSVAGLRLAGASLELLDAQGTPRLRVTRPFVVDANGRRTNASLSVEGCAIDTSGAPPWGRPVTPPGADTCTLHVSWGKVAYPAIVDPVWQGTGSPQGSRYNHATLTIGGGRVFTFGGFYEPDGGQGRRTEDSGDLFDPATRTWTGYSMIFNGRQNLALGLLPSGKILIIGGGISRHTFFTPGGATDTPMDGVTSADFLTATSLVSGKVLVVGGYVFGTPSAFATVYDEGTNTFTNATPLATARGRHTATRLASGKVLVAGGEGASGVLASAEIYDPTTNAFTATAAPMANARAGHAAVLLADGRVLLVGGRTATAELYDPATNRFTSAGSLSAVRSELQAVRLDSGRVMVAGGEVAGSSVGNVEIFDPVTKTFSAQPPLSFARSSFGLSLLPNGDVLANGGKAPNATSVRNAEVWSPTGKGIECRVGDDCLSGTCQQGICCAGPCAGPCKTCLAGTGACVAVTGTDDPDDCTGTNTCDAAGACKQKNGRGCTGAADCASGFCVDGFCCEKACSGQCEACDVKGNEGRCLPVAGEPHGGRTRCAKGDANCGGTCDGIGTTCAFPSAVTTCGRICTDKLTTVSTCDGRGACVTGSPQNCPGNFVCKDATDCKVECASDTDCLEGYRCENKVCNAVALCKGTVVTKGKETLDCAPYTCEQAGICRTSCASVAECAEPNLCSADGLCVPPPAPPSDGCAVSPSGRESSPDRAFAWTMVAIALGVVAAGRRRR